MPKSSFQANAEGMSIFPVRALLKDLAAFAALLLFLTSMALTLPELSSAIHDGRQVTLTQATEE